MMTVLNPQSQEFWKFINKIILAVKIHELLLHEAGVLLIK